jgi:alkanesulfonate monooxygenase SsuD/methylene tetrahydromethanopterin reductase-like flavin-dependent oxidoreductase (luciferase family)
MKIGILSQGASRAAGDTRPLSEIYAASIQRAQWLEQMGYDYSLLGEHHFFENQWNPSPLILISAMAQATSVLRLGTNVLLTPFYNPLRLAEDVAVLDNISNGRIDLICGSASITREFETFGIDPDTRFGRVWETLGFLRRAFSEETFDHKGKYYNFPNVTLTTYTVQQPFPLWFGGFGPKMIARAAKEGYHFYGNRNADIYLDGLKAADRNIDDYNLGMAGGTITVVASDKEADEVRDRVMQAAAAHNAEYSETGRDLAFQFQSSSAARQAPFIGTPDKVLEFLEPRFKDSVVTHFQTGGETRSLELFAKEVAPVLRKWGREPVNSR